MIDLGTNNILWYREMEEKESTQPVSGEWDQDPDFPNVTKAVNIAMKKAKSLLEKDFFKQ